MVERCPVPRSPDLSDLIPAEHIANAILTIRGQRVMLDADLAELYGVTTSRLNEQVRRNAGRFPADFMFQLTAEEAALRSQIAILKTGRGQHRKYLPFAFTQEGVAMLSSVLHSERAIAVNIEIMRAFVKVRRLVAFEAEIRQRFLVLEATTGGHTVHIAALYQAIHDLMSPPDTEVKRIGFRPDEV